MRAAATVSVLLHVGVVALVAFGLPRPEREFVPRGALIDVEVVSEADLLAASLPAAEEVAALQEPPPPPPPDRTPPPPPSPPPPTAAPAPQPEAAPTTAPTPPRPPEAPPEPPPAAAREPEPAVAQEPEPAPEPEPVATSEPQPQPAATPSPPPPQPPEPPAEEPPVQATDVVEAQPQPVDMPRPPSKPAEPRERDFASVLQTVQDLKQDQPPPQPEREPEPERKPERAVSLEDAVRQALQGSRQEPDPAQRSAIRAESALTMSEMDAVRRQIAGCWNVPAGARDARDLVVEVRIEVRPDRTVQNARLLNASAASDPFWRTAAESALRAVLNPRCSPLQLPPDKYNVWQSIIFTFNPQEMLG